MTARHLGVQFTAVPSDDVLDQRLRDCPLVLVAGRDELVARVAIGATKPNVATAAEAVRLAIELEHRHLLDLAKAVHLPFSEWWGIYCETLASLAHAATDTSEPVFHESAELSPVKQLCLFIEGKFHAQIVHKVLPGGASRWQWVAFVAWIVLFVLACALTPLASADYVLATTMSRVRQCALSYRCRPQQFVAAAVQCGNNKYDCMKWSNQSQACSMVIDKGSVTWFTHPQHQVSLSFRLDVEATAYCRVATGHAWGRVTLLWVPDATVGFLPSDCSESDLRWMVVSVVAGVASLTTDSINWFRIFVAIAGAVVMGATAMETYVQHSRPEELRLFSPQMWPQEVVRRLILCGTVAFIVCASWVPSGPPCFIAFVLKIAFAVVASWWFRMLNHHFLALVAAVALCAIATITVYCIAPAAIAHHTFLFGTLNDWVSLLVRHDTWLAPLVFGVSLHWRDDTSVFRIMAMRCSARPNGRVNDGSWACTRYAHGFLGLLFAIAFTAFLVLSVIIPHLDRLLSLTL